MSQVVLLTYAGVPCALPASQVLGAAAAQSEPEIRLWPGHPDASEHGTPVVLLVETAAGRRQFVCGDVRFAWLDEEPMRALPEVLRACIGLPHVVGICRGEESLVWLVDLQCWEDA